MGDASRSADQVDGPSGAGPLQATRGTTKGAHRSVGGRSSAVAILLLMSAAAVAQNKRVEKPAGDADLAAQVARLQQEVSSMRQVLTYLLQDQQQKATLFLQVLQGSGAPAPKPLGLGDSSGSVAVAGEVAPASPAPASGGSPAGKPTAPIAKTAPTLTGVVTSSTGTLPTGTFVYVDDASAGAARNKTLEIRQQDKQFVPSAAVVQRGTRLVFPNYDAVFHNVFSPSAGNSFDLGAYQAGEKARSVVVSKPGVVEIFCNLHSRMAASVLVVPGPSFAAVDAQGRFRLEGVAPGKRTLVVWAPDAEPVSKSIEVGGDVTDVKLSIEPGRSKTHVNKHGQPYGSYGD
jgi:plastocyanin